jgi:hypothetical protein
MFLEFLEKPLKHLKVVLKANGLGTTSVEHNSSKTKKKYKTKKKKEKDSAFEELATLRRPW